MQSQDEDEEDLKLLNMSGKTSATGGGNKLLQKNLGEDNKHNG